MTAPKQNSPSFASVISILSILFYCAGFLRVELELTEQQKRISVLETTAETKALSNDPDINMRENAQFELVAVFPWKKKTHKRSWNCKKLFVSFTNKTFGTFQRKGVIYSQWLQLNTKGMYRI